MTEENFYGNPQTAEDFPPIQVYGLDFRMQLLHLHQAITKLRFWEQMKEDPGKDSFMFTDACWVNKIKNHPDVVYDRHSGATIAYGCGIMQFIAINGWEKFFEKFSEDSEN